MHLFDKNKQSKDFFEECDEGWMMRGNWWGVSDEGWGVNDEWWGVNNEGWAMRGERWGVRDEGEVMKGEWWGVSYEEVNNFGIYFVRFQLQLDQGRQTLHLIVESVRGVSEPGQAGQKTSLRVFHQGN